jgi:hypothetical protein
MEEKISNLRGDRGASRGSILPAAAVFAFILPLTGGAQQLASFSDTLGEHMFYADNDAHVRQLYWDVSAWANQDLTTLSGASNLAAWGFTRLSALCADGRQLTNQNLTMASSAANLAALEQIASRRRSAARRSDHAAESARSRRANASSSATNCLLGISVAAWC